MDETKTTEVEPFKIEEMAMVEKKSSIKSYASVIGGFIYMLRLGSEYMSSSIAPYIASYYDVEIKQA